MKWILIAILCFLTSVQHAHSQDSVATLQQTIKVGKANHIKALVKISGGKLLMDGGSAELADVLFEYTKKDWNPTISYTENADLGKLAIIALSEESEHRIDDHNQCSISLNPKNSYSLGIVLGAGMANLDFHDFSIQKALFKLGVGSFKINLSNTSIPLLKIDAGIGEATVNLSGKWKNSMKAFVNAGIGQIEFIVPADIGVKFIVSGFLGEVETPGYLKKGKEYTNLNFGKTKHQLVLKVNGSIGSIVVKEQ